MVGSVQYPAYVALSACRLGRPVTQRWSIVAVIAVISFFVIVTTVVITRYLSASGLYILSRSLMRSRMSSVIASALGNAVVFGRACMANTLFIICSSSSLIRSFSLRPSLSLSLRFSFSHSPLSPVVVVWPSSTSGGFRSFSR